MCRKLFLLTSFVLVMALVGSNPAFGETIERRVAASDDDAEEHVLESGKMEGLSSSDLELGYESGSSLQTVGIRLLDIQIPQGAAITSAWVQFDADDIDNDYHALDVSLIIEGEGSPNPVAFTSNAGDITSRLVTTASVVWDVPQWLVKHGQGPEEQTPDISAIIQEIVDQPDWVAGNAIVLLFRDNPANPSVGTREAESFDGTAEAAALLHIEYAEGPPPAGANIVWVTATRDFDLDGVQDDQGFIDWIVAEGHNVDVRLDYWGELDLEPNKVDELNAADLVIVSRSCSSGDHDDGDEPTLWNSVTSPLITLNCFLVRSSRWRWMDTTTVVNADDIMLAIDPTHPLFEGVTLEAGSMVIFRDNTVGSGQMSFVGSIDAGNGTLIAQGLSADNAWIAEWAADVEFYAGSGETAGGPRMLFSAGTQETDVPPTPWGAWDLTADGEQMLRNAIAYMLPAAEEPPAAAGPVAHWQLDEGSGTLAADSSGNGLDGTLVGDPNWVLGIIGGALEFDGVDDNVDCGNLPILDFATGDWTLSAWMNAAVAPSSDLTIVGKGGDHSSEALPGVRYQLMLDNENSLHLVVDDDITKFDPMGEIPLIDGQWHHVVMMRRNGTELRAYVDGVEDMGVTNHGESTIPDTYDLSGTSMFNAYIGAIVHAGDSTPDMVVLEKLFAGMIDDVRIYDYALSEAEVAALASGQ